VKEGDRVKADAHLGEVETDKAIVEMPSPKTGTILKLHRNAGEIIHVGEVMVTILLDNETADDAKKHAESKSAGAAASSHAAPSQSTKSGDVPYTGSVVGFVEEAKDVSPIYGQQPAQSAPHAAQAPAEVQATPAVRMLAKQLNVNLANVKGTGPGGRIQPEDVKKSASGGQTQAAPAQSASASAAPAGGFKKVRKYDMFGYVDRETLHGIRKIVASRMSDSMYTAPQVTNMHEVDVTDLWAMREKEKSEYEKEGVKLTLMPYLTKLVSCSLANHPRLNAMIEGEDVVFKKYFNIGIAVDSEEGLAVPVVKRAEAKDVKAIAKEIEKLAADVKSRKVNMMDLKGGTFTISNLGSVGVYFFTPIINLPESAILGIGRMADKPVVRNGQVVVRKMLPLSLTYDHRIVDGADAARFMNELSVRIEKLDFSVPELKDH
jgi:pyruvate dehydrogenase E2 component (dihydrolipoamide acetyltransferase)